MDEPRKRRKAEQRHERAEERTRRLLEVATLIGVYGGLLMPLVYARVVIYPFVYLKMLYFQILVGLTFPAWAALAIRDPRFRLPRSPLSWSILAWFCAMGLSTLFAANPWRAFFGTQERMTGLLSLVHFLCWFVMASSVMTKNRDWRRLANVQIGVGLIVACTTLLQLALPNFIRSTEAVEGERIAGLLGNPIFASAYQCFSVFLVLLLWKAASIRSRYWYGLALASAFGVLVFTGSRGPVVGLVVGLFVAGVYYASATRKRWIAWTMCGGVVVLVAIYAAMVAFVVERPELQAFWKSHANLMHLFESRVDPARVRLWRAAWDGFLSRPVLGWGPVNFETAFEFAYRPIYHSLGTEDEPHNRFLNVLCETGIVGGAAYLTLWATYFGAVVRMARRRVLEPEQCAALLGIGVGHFVQNLFAFDTPATYLSTYLLLAIVVASSAEIGDATQPARTARALDRWVPANVISVAMIAVVIFGSVMPGIASVYSKRAALAMRRGDWDAMLFALGRSNATVTPYHDDQLVVVVQGILNAVKAKAFDNWPKRTTAINLAASIYEKHASNHGSHIRLRRAYATMLLVLGKSQHERRFLDQARALYDVGLRECPNRQRYLIDMARFQAETGNFTDAEYFFRKAHELDPTMGEPRWELGKFLWNQLGKPEDGARLMASSSAGFDRFWPSNAVEWQQLAQAYSRSGQIAKLGEVVDAVYAFPQSDRPLEVHIGIARYLEKSALMKERDQVLRLARERNPSAARAIDAVLSGKLRVQDLQVNRQVRLSQASSSAAPRSSTEAPRSLANLP